MFISGGSNLVFFSWGLKLCGVFLFFFCREEGCVCVFVADNVQIGLTWLSIFDKFCVNTEMEPKIDKLDNCLFSEWLTNIFVIIKQIKYFIVYIVLKKNH